MILKLRSASLDYLCGNKAAYDEAHKAVIEKYGEALASQMTMAFAMSVPFNLNGVDY